MNSIKKILFLAVVLLTTFCTKAAAEDVPTKIYAFGFSQTFNDSTVYFTDIQELDSAWVDSKTKLLYSRNSYSYQMREYLQQVEGVKNPVCSIIFAFKRKDLEKKMQKMKTRYQKEKYNYIIKYLNDSDFKFEAIAAADEYIPLTKEQKKAERKAEKERRKAEKKGRKDGRAPGSMPPPPGGGQPGAGAPPSGGMGGHM